MTCTTGADNVTFYCLTDGVCLNVTDVCDGVDDCEDGSDESFTHAHCYDVYLAKHRLTVLEIVALIVGCVIAAAVFCCMLGSAVECVVHVYRYWCPASVRKACCGRVQTGQCTDTVSAAPSMTQPVILLLKELPPNCSTIVVACRPIHEDQTISGDDIRLTAIDDGDGGGAGGAGDKTCTVCGRSSDHVTMTSRFSRHRSGSVYSASGRSGVAASGGCSGGYHARGRSSFRSTPFGPTVIRPSTGSDVCSACAAAADDFRRDAAAASTNATASPTAGGGLRTPGASPSYVVRSPIALATRHRVEYQPGVDVGSLRSVVILDDGRLANATRLVPSAPTLPPSYSSLCVRCTPSTTAEYTLSASSASTRT